MNQDWSPERYDAFATARQRPTADLIAGVPETTTDHITDLGCGSGLSTLLLAQRWPQAQISGVDRSPAMLAQAKERVPAARFVEADIAAYTSERAQDLIVANASLHWLDHHSSLMPRLVQNLRSGGTFAVQMPDNLDQPSHTLMDDVAREAAFASALRKIPGRRAPLSDPETYYDILAPHCRCVDIFSITYRHRLKGAEAIADFFATTGLKPYLDPLDAPLRESFLRQYEARLRAAYPQRVDGSVLLSLPRLFIIAIRS